jgi:predicted Zn-dependent protease
LLGGNPERTARFSGTDEENYRTGGTIKLYTRELDKESDNGALATIVHEMGHALGLTHRTNKNDVMNANISDSTNANPDNLDFANLLAIYGT